MTNWQENTVVLTKNQFKRLIENLEFEASELERATANIREYVKTLKKAIGE